MPTEFSSLIFFTSEYSGLLSHSFAFFKLGNLTNTSLVGDHNSSKITSICPPLVKYSPPNFSTRGFKEQQREIFKTKGDRYRTYLKISLEKALIKSFDDYIIENR